MKKQVIEEQIFCDFCGRQSYAGNDCLKCKMNICWECQKTKAVKYSHAIYFSGSGDGLYCQTCDAELEKRGDSLHRAYRKIRALIEESNRWNENFEQRKKLAEAELKAML